MRQSKVFVPLILLALIALIIAGTFALRSLLQGNAAFTYSGTIEATEYHLGSEKGGRIDIIEVQEGDSVSSGQIVAVVRGERVRSPIDGVVLERIAEPGEIVMPGGTLLTVANLDQLTLTVYVPEDRYGKIMLGQICNVRVDSFPGETFLGKVSYIANRAEFTPRNVQTVDSRKSTVFAIRLDLDPSNRKLKPGMPADVTFQPNH
ncbi:MAG: HlyD family efflux transporter periplasmic adaptor subunit [Anaerolineae bacterium]|nr:HlyD family efflux transporter periplasmic adaptor subunit [Anaerolineae bacterium]